MIKAICFDLDGVYFTAAGFSAFKDRLLERGADIAVVNEQLHGGPMQAFKRGETDEDIFWEEAITTLGIDITPSEIKQLLVAEYSVNQEVHAYVMSARAAGYKTCICSNNFVSRVNGLEEKFNFLQHFDAAVFSYEVGELKPSRAVFTELLGRLDMSPQELTYSDDNSDKLTGAQELGINTFTYRGFEQFQQELTSLGVTI